jgi:hypothetical protein
MRRMVAVLSVLAALALPATAAATTQTAHARNVTATFSYTFKGDISANVHLTIARGGAVVYSHPVVGPRRVCGTDCRPGGAPGHKSVHVIDLNHNGSLQVVLDLMSEGAHCCFVEQVFTFHPKTNTYTYASHDFGDPGARIVDLAHNGRHEFLTRDDTFAYRFDSFAASGLPIQILRFSGGYFRNVTRHYPKLIAAGARLWLKAYKATASQQWQDGSGAIAAWAADDDLLGHSSLVKSYLGQQAATGHINGFVSGRTFVTQLQKFLHRHGYV